MNLQASNNAPSAAIVLPYYGVAALFWLASLVLAFIHFPIWLSHYYNPTVLALTHLVVLGFITTLIFGALHQLIPVLFQTKLYNELAAIITLVTLITGTLSLVISLYMGTSGILLIFAGGLLTASILIFCINVALTFLQKPTLGLEKIFILTGLFWLTLTAGLGLLMVLNRTTDFVEYDQFAFLKIHVHTGLIGWFLQLIIGVSLALLPMFFLNHAVKKNSAKFAYVAINIALVLGILGQSLQIFALIPVAIGIGVLGVLAYLYVIFDLYLHRVKRKLDLGMKTSMVSFLFLLIPLILAVLIQFTGIQSGNFGFSGGFVVTFVFGFVTTLILGQTFKTLPFIVWLKVYKSAIGKEKTPLPKDLVDESVQRIQSILHPLGFCFLLTGMVFESKVGVIAGLLLLLIAAILYTYNVFHLLLHKKKRHENKG